MTYSKLAYLAAPYTASEPGVTEARVAAVMRFDAFLMKQGIYTTSPIYKHLMVQHVPSVPGTWEYWKEYSKQLLASSNCMYVLCLPGWRESVGLQAEIKLAEELGIRIFYATPLGDSFSNLYPSIASLERSTFTKV